MKKSILSFCVASLLGATGIANALPFQNGSFEDPILGQFAPIGSRAIYFPSAAFPIAGWTLESGSILWVGDWQADQGTLSIGMNGLSPGILSQTFDTVADTSYEVVFAMAGNPTGGDPIKDIEVSAPGYEQVFTFDTTGKSIENMGWANIPFTFLATGALSTLTFASLENNQFGPAIDNVRLNVANGGGAPVPEPATMLLLGTGLTGLAFFGRKKILN